MPHTDLPDAPQPQADPDPTDAHGWLVRARERSFLGDAAGTLLAVERGLESATGMDRALLLGARLSALVGSGDLRGAQQWLAPRTEALRAAGNDYQADLEDRLRLVLFGAADDVDGSVLERELAAAQAAGAHYSVADLAVTLAYLDGQNERREAALTHAETAVSAADTLGDALDELRSSAQYLQARALAVGTDPGVAIAFVDGLLDSGVENRGRRADLLRVRSRLHAGTRAFEAALADAEAALALSVAVASSEHAIDDATLTAAILGDLGRPDDSIARLRLAVQIAEQSGSPRIALTRYALGQRLVGTGSFQEAAELLRAVLAQEESTGASASDRGQTLWLLGQALRGLDEPGGAAAAWGTAVELFEESESWAAVAQASHSLGQLHLDHGHVAEAVAVLERGAVAARRSTGETQSLANVLHALGRAHAAAGDVQALSDLDEVERLAREAGAQWVVADVTDSRARALAALGRLDEAVPVAREAADLYVAAGDPGSAGGARLLRARLLRTGGNLEDAVEAYRRAVELFVDVPDGARIARLELAEVLDQLGRADDATRVRDL
jgi:tetratricopeptide (TPR) repeat protein